MMSITRFRNRVTIGDEIQRWASDYVCFNAYTSTIGYGGHLTLAVSMLVDASAMTLLSVFKSVKFAKIIVSLSLKQRFNDKVSH